MCDPNRNVRLVPGVILTSRLRGNSVNEVYIACLLENPLLKLCSVRATLTEQVIDISPSCLSCITLASYVRLNNKA